MSLLTSTKISTRIVVAFGLALPITFWSLGSDTYNTLNDYRRAETVAKQNAAANALIAGVYEMLIERQYVNNALQAANPATDADFKDINGRRNVARAKIQPAFDDLLKQEFPNKDALIKEFRAAQEKADKFRSNADSAIKLGKDSRDAETVKSTYAVLSNFVVTAQKLWSGVLRNTSALDTELGRLANIRVLAWNMRDTAGRERATISSAIAAKVPLSADNLSNIKTIRAQVDQMWMLLQIYLDANDHAALMKGVQSIKDGYFGKFQPLADQMRKASAAAEPYPMPLNQWIDTSTDLLSTILDVMYGASEASEAYTANLQQSALRKLTISGSLMLSGLLLLIGAAVFSVWTVARPLQALARPVNELAAGNFAVDVPGSRRGDEIGQIAGAIETMVTRMSTVIAEINSAARDVSLAAGEISISTADLSQRIEEEAASLEETTAAMEEISSMVRNNANNANQSKQSALATSEVADRGGAVVVKAVDAMARIEESARKISDIIGVIDEIARQTNLLALNAAVEAARAGEAGRGFAVVAAEVRSLAQRSSRAAKDITALITNSNGEVKEGVELVNKAGAALDEIITSTKSVAERVSEIASASNEQSTGVEQVNKALTQIDEVTQKNAALVEENAATAKVLESLAASMRDQVAFFRIRAAEAAAVPSSRRAATSTPVPAPRAAA